MTSSSVRTTASTSPVVSASSRQPPSSSGSTSSPIACEVTSGLETARKAPRRMTQKSDSAEYQVEEPRHGPNTALTQGVSRRRQYCWLSCPISAMDFAPMVSGRREPVLSPRNTSGMPARVAWSFM